MEFILFCCWCRLTWQILWQRYCKLRYGQNKNARYFHSRLFNYFLPLSGMGILFDLIDMASDFFSTNTFYPIHSLYSNFHFEKASKNKTKCYFHKLVVIVVYGFILRLSLQVTGVKPSNWNCYSKNMSEKCSFIVYKFDTYCRLVLVHTAWIPDFALVGCEPPPQGIPSVSFLVL